MKESIDKDQVVCKPRTVRTKPFDPAKFLGNGFTIWKGPVDGDGLSGEDDVCPQSLAIVEIELSSFIFRNCLKEGEGPITNEERIRRLNEMPDFSGFGPNVFLGLWEDYQINKEDSALEWLHRNFGVTSMDFPRVFLRSRGNCWVLSLHRDADGSWGWDCYCLIYPWHAECPSAGCMN